MTPSERDARLKARDSISLLAELERVNNVFGRSQYAFGCDVMGREEYAELRREVLRRMTATPTQMKAP